MMGDVRSNPITNLVRQPRPTSVHTGAGYGTQNLAVVTGLVGAPGGTTTAMRVSYTSTAAGGTNNPGYLFDMRNAVVGEFLTISAWIMFESGPVSGFGFAISAQAAGKDQPDPATLGVWARYTWRIRATSTNQIGFRLASLSTGTQFSGSYLITNIMVESNSSLHTFSDGQMPGWKVNADGTSVGYPYTLESVVGNPLIKIMSGSETADQIVDAVTPQGAFDAFSLFTVWDTLNLDSAYVNVGYYGGFSTTDGRIQQRAGQAVNSTIIDTRSDFKDGLTNVVTGRSGSRVAGKRNIACVQLNQGLTDFRFTVAGFATSSRTNTAENIANGLPIRHLVLGRKSASDYPQAMFVLPYDISTTMRDEAFKWLGHAYGA